ncbi:MAG: hypothetical protein GC137_08155 [Alphaproteobacteria bacterium]|nr:hypothetical protein [Alphaproteobacteria bacterium]
MSTNKDQIENAGEIIEKFGGIRPMASKIDVAVTTVQGWKKRDVIPANRKQTILDAAIEHQINLSDYFDDAPPILVSEQSKEQDNKKTPPQTNDEIDIPDTIKSTENQETGSVKSFHEQMRSTRRDEFLSPILPRREQQNHKRRADQRDIDSAEVARIAMEAERRAIKKSAILIGSIVLLIVVSTALFVRAEYNQYAERMERIQELENEVSDIKSAQSSFKGIVTKDWSEQIDELKAQMKQAQTSALEGFETAKQASSEYLDEQNIPERVVEFQTYVSEMTSGDSVFGLLSKFEGMEKTEDGKRSLESSIAQLSSLLRGLSSEDEDEMNTVIADAREQSAALNKTLGDVPQNELKAAALLLTMSQVRSALNRDSEAFDEDLALLLNMISDDNQELRDALLKLAPHSKTGILTAKGLQDEFRTLAGEAVAASLKGENVTFSEKAAARLNQILQIEKDGELVTGTETQAKVKKAEGMINEGRFEEAMNFLKTQLKSKELEPLRPFIQKLEAFLASQKVQEALKKYFKYIAYQDSLSHTNPADLSRRQ